MAEPLCPECGSPMVLRTARRGKNAGSQFYGCSRFPMCKATVALEEETSTMDSVSNYQEQTDFPQAFFARSLAQDRHVRFFEATGITYPIMDDLEAGRVGDSYLRAFSQWRLDYPDGIGPYQLVDEEISLLSVAEKILTRGSITLVSPKVEQALIDLFQIPSKLNISENDLITSYTKMPFVWLDSSAEQIFLERLVAEFGPDVMYWIVPQVSIRSLVPNVIEDIDGRVDFLICHPRMNSPMVVEIDGDQHESHTQADVRRDEALRQSGFTVVRIKSSVVADEFSIDEVLFHLRSLISMEHSELSKEAKLLTATKICHQLQLTFIQAIRVGILPLANQWEITTDLCTAKMFTEDEVDSLLQIAVDDFKEFIGHLASLYSVSLDDNSEVSGEEAKLHISFGFAESDAPTFIIHNLSLPFHLANDAFPSSAAVLQEPSVEDVEYFLQYIFRKPTLWEGQFDAISRTLQGRDSIVLLPTGAGKSIAFQLASILLPGRTIVIEPIISLIEDQLDNLASYGITRCIGITSLLNNPEDRSKAIALFGQGEYIFAYIAPERFQTVEFRDSLRSLTVHTPVSTIVVDEAHCVSEWGHDFRTSYLNIGRTTREYCESNGHVPPLLALTGTASRAVLKDVQRELQIEDFEAIITPASFDRKELKFQVITSRSSEKFDRLKGYLTKLPSLFSATSASFYQGKGKNTYAGLIFAPHVNGEYGVVEIAKKIQKEVGISTDYYSGKPPRYLSKENWVKVKRSVARRFKRDELPLLVSTKAFGMGIDKPNIRYTIHYGIPGSIESFYQEAGRAGRDRKTSYCCILVSDDDPERNKYLLNPNTKVEQIAKLLDSISRDEADDITRALFFHVNSFRGIATELQDIQQILGALDNPSAKGTRTLSIRGMDRNSVEKGIHRLLLISVVDDYTVNYSADEFTVQLSGNSKDQIIEAYGKYVSGYLGSRVQTELNKARRYYDLEYSQFVLKMAELLLNFIYDVIERGRRRALYEMVLAATTSSSDKDIRQRILRYLEATGYSENLDKLLAEPDAGFDLVIRILEDVYSPNNAAELRGQVSRYLESYPDHPGLLMLRALTEMSAKDKNLDVARENFLAAVDSALESYDITEDELFPFITWALSQVYHRNQDFGQALMRDLLEKYRSNNLARTMIQTLPEGQSGDAAWYLLDNLNQELSRLGLTSRR